MAAGDRPRILLSERKLQARIRTLGRQITRDYQGTEPILIGVLKGSFIFMADLVRQVDLKVSVDFLRISSYGAGTESSGTVRVDFDMTQPIKGRHVVLIEDIIDTGLTARSVLALLRARRPASLALCTLLHKPARARVKVPIDYCGFSIPNEFVVGFGLDHAGRFRNLPYVGVVG